MTSFQATLVNTGFGQLILRDSLGKVAQKWTLSNPKCVIGSGTNCNVSCQLPGIVDHHVLMVIGAKQVFIRAMASGLTRNGQNISELVLPGTETEFNFEIAGHHFQFARDGVSTPVAKEFVQEASVAATKIPAAQVPPRSSASPTEVDPVAPVAQVESSTLALAPSRLKFTVVRALEKNRQSGENASALIDSGISSSRPAWVEAIVRDALRPVEERLDDLNGPLQNIERRMRRQRAQLRKARKQAEARGELATPAQPTFVPVLAPELIQSQTAIEHTLQQQNSRLEMVVQSVGQVVARLTDVDRQLSTNQVERQELSQQFQQSNQQILSLQREMTEMFQGLQSQLAQFSPAQAGSEARLWQSNVEAQLAELQATLLALDDIKTTLQVAVEYNRTLRNDWDAQQQKLNKLVAESTQKAVTEALSQTNHDSETLAQVVGDKVCDSVREQLGPRFTNEIAQQLSDGLNNDFASPLTSNLSSQLSDQIASQFSNQVSGELARQLATFAPGNSAPVNSEEIVQAVRGTLTELLAPLASTLQSGLQQAIQQAVDQSVQQSVQLSVQQSVQQTIAPMIEAAAAAQIRAVAAMPLAQRSSEGMAAANSVELTYPPASEPAAYPSAYPSAYADSPADQPIDSARDSQAFQGQAHEGQSYQGQAYQPDSYQGVDNSQGFDSQPYTPPGYQSQTPAPQAYDSQAYDSQAYDSQAFDSQAFDSQAYASGQAAAADEPQGLPMAAPIMDSHQELPSWWSEDPVATQRDAQANPVSADRDGDYRQHYHSSEESFEPGAAAYDSAYAPTNDPVHEEPQAPYAQSAFSSDQLDLGGTGAAPLQNAYEQEAFDSVPYSELVNRKPIRSDEEYPEDSDVPAEFPSGYSPYDSQPADVVPVGAAGGYPIGSDDAYSDAPYAGEEFPADEYAGADVNAEELNNIAQAEHMTQSVPIADNPTVPASQVHSGEENDESVEDYMRRLLARMRGVSESEVSLPGVEVSKPAPAPAVKDPSVEKPAAMVGPPTETQQMSEAWTEPFDPEKYVPRGSAPEKNRDLNALRELANNSARSAIQVSARRRQGSAILIKSAIALVGLVAGIAIVSINGARINIAFIATIASFMVAVIWGYDAVTSIRPLLQSNRQPKSQRREATAEAKTAKADDVAS